MAEKQISVVLQAVTEGCRTSVEVSATTGLSVHVASANLYFLYEAGLIRRRRDRVKYSGGVGRACFTYEAA